MNQCAVFPQPGQVVLRDIQMPVPQKGEALLKILYGGICGSDLNSYRGASAYVSYPRIPGHEFSAEIVAVEENDLGLEKGMLVTANPYFNCGSCYSCKRGMVNCCTTNQTMGVQREGAFANYITMPITRIYPVIGLSPVTAALIEPFCISYHGVSQASVNPGERVLVMGAGTIGVLAMAAAKLAGAEVYISDVSAEKLEMAKKMGADGVILNNGKESFDAQVSGITQGDGFDVTIEAVGLPVTFQDCIDAAAFGGRVVVIGVAKQNLDFNFTIIQKKELKIFGSRNAVKKDFVDVIELIQSGKFAVEEIVTNTYSFKEVDKAFREFDQGADSMLKVLIKF